MNRRYSCPFVSISGSITLPFVLFVLFVVPSSLTEAHCKVSTHYLLLSSPSSLLLKPTAKCPRTTFSFLLPLPYFRVHSCPLVVLSLQWTRGGIAVRARSSAPSTHYPLLSSPSSLLYQTGLYCVIYYKKPWLRENAPCR